MKRLPAGKRQLIDWVPVCMITKMERSSNVVVQKELLAGKRFL